MNIFALVDFINIFLAVYIGAFVYAKDTSSKLNQLFLLNCLLAAYTGFCEYFRLTAPDESTALMWNKASFVWPFFPYAYTLFAMYLTNSSYSSNRRIIILLALPAAFISSVHLLTSQLYAGMELNWYGWHFIPKQTVFSVFIPVYVVSTTIFSFILIINYYIRQKEKRKRLQAIFAAIGLTIPLVTGFITELIIPLLGGESPPPVAALAFLYGTFFLSVSLLKYNFFITDPLTAINQVFATINDYLIIYNQNGRIVAASKSFLTSSGYNEAEIIDKELSQLFYYGSNHVSIELLVETGKEIEIYLKTRNNEFIPISTITSVINDNSRNEKLFILLGRDLRERKLFEKELLLLQRELEDKVIERTAELTKSNKKLEKEIEGRIIIEQALRESEKRYKDLFENSPIGIYRTTPDGKILLANPALVKMLKYDNLQELLNRNLEKEGYEVRSYTRDTFKENIEATGEIIGLEARWLRKDGSVIVVRENARCMYDSTGKVAFYDGTIEDITEQVKASEALKESEEKFKVLAEQAPSMIAIYCEGEILYVNKKCAELLGCSVDYLTSSSFDFKSVILGTPYFDINSEEFISGEKALTNILTIKCKNGKLVETFISIKMINYSGKRAILVILTDITERMQIEKKLRESEEKYRGLVENINAIYYVSLNHGKIIYLSPNAVTFTGYQTDELIGKTAFHLIYKEDQGRVIRFYLESVERGKIDTTIEFRLAKKDGSYFWAEQITRIIRDERGLAVEYRNVVRDITERKLAENALTESEERYRSLFENTSAVMLLIDPFCGLIMGANNAALDYYGYSKYEFLQMNISQIDVSPNIDPILFLIKPDEERKENFHHKKVNGEIRDVEIHSGLVKVNQKELIFSIVFDITKRRHAERQLEEYKNQLENLVAERTRKLNNVNSLLEQEIKKLKIAEENIQYQLNFLQTLIDTIPNPIFFLDKDKTFTACNRAYEEFYKISRSEIIGRTVFQIPSFPSPDIFDKKNDKLLKDSREQKYEKIIFSSEGDERYIMVHNAALKKNDGSVDGIVGILFDITEIKTLEKEVRIALEKEKELSELKSRFISVTSHEFRTPLTSILTSADLLEMYGRKWPDSKYYEYVGHIQKAVEYMTELINDVLTVSRSDSSKIQHNPTKINFYDLLNNIIENLKLSVTSKIEFNFNYCIKEKIFYLDSKLITQIVSNLLSNAVKYSPDGGNVDLIVNRENNYLIICVKDHGIGISEEDQQRLFEPFFRGQNVGTISGTGLGLSIAQKSAEIHNGKLTVSSKINEGTTFTVKINFSQ